MVHKKILHGGLQNVWNEFSSLSNICAFRAQRQQQHLSMQNHESAVSMSCASAKTDRIKHKNRINVCQQQPWRLQFTQELVPLILDLEYNKVFTGQICIIWLLSKPKKNYTQFHPCRMPFFAMSKHFNKTHTNTHTHQKNLRFILESCTWILK